MMSAKELNDALLIASKALSEMGHSLGDVRMDYNLEKPFKIVKLKLDSESEIIYEQADMKIIYKDNEWKISVEGDFKNSSVDRFKKNIWNGKSESFYAELGTGENISGKVILTHVDAVETPSIKLEYTVLGEVSKE